MLNIQKNDSVAQVKKKAATALRQFATGVYDWCEVCGPIERNSVMCRCGECWHYSEDQKSGACAGTVYDFFPDSLMEAVALIVGKEGDNHGQ